SPLLRALLPSRRLLCRRRLSRARRALLRCRFFGFAWWRFVRVAFVLRALRRAECDGVGLDGHRLAGVALVLSEIGLQLGLVRLALLGVLHLLFLRRHRLRARGRRRARVRARHVATAGVRPTARCFGMTTPSTPVPSAERSNTPKFCGSCSESMSRTSAGSLSASRWRRNSSSSTPALPSAIATTP